MKPWSATAARSVHATDDEKVRPLPGDELIPTPVGSLHHAITIGRPRQEVWPWLAQMGAGSRAGWYSYDFIDNARHQSATHIIQELQRVEVGMIFPALPGATDGFVVLAVRPEHFLVLGWTAPDGSHLMTWAFVLEDVEPQSTRLIVRTRGGPGYRFHGLPWWAAKRIVAAIHFVMERKQLLGIARRVEQRTPRAPEVTRR